MLVCYDGSYLMILIGANQKATGIIIYFAWMMTVYPNLWAISAKIFLFIYDISTYLMSIKSSPKLT